MDPRPLRDPDPSSFSCSFVPYTPSPDAIEHIEVRKSKKDKKRHLPSHSPAPSTSPPHARLDAVEGPHPAPPTSSPLETIATSVLQASPVAAAPEVAPAATPANNTSETKDQSSAACTRTEAYVTVREHLLASATAATVSTIAVQPLDVLRTRLQVRHVPKMYNNGNNIKYGTNNSVLNKNMYTDAAEHRRGIFGSLTHIGRTEGLRGLYRGVLPSLVSVVPSVSIYFTLYSQLKRVIHIPPTVPHHDTVTQALAAGIASCSTTAVTNPLWVVKTRLQTMPVHKPVATTATATATATAVTAPAGLTRGFCTWRPSPSTIAHVSRVCSPFFPTGVLASPFRTIRSVLGHHPTRQFLTSPPSVSSTLGSVARATSVSCCMGSTMGGPAALGTPDTSSGAMRTVRLIAQTEGIRGFYRGLSASLLASSQAVVQFPLYESLKRTMFDCTEGVIDDETRRIALSFLTASALAASIASVATYPCEVVRSRMQVQGAHPHLPRKYRSVWHAFKLIFREEGARGLYRGLGTSLVRLTPSHALSFTTYEFMLRLLKDS